VSAAVLRALAVSIVADARAELARAEAHAAQLNALAKDMGRAVEGDPVQLVNATVAGVGRAVWNRAARSAWLASIASPPPPASNVKNETEEPADTFERARARARDRQAA
jgi:hypothetical protein